MSAWRFWLRLVSVSMVVVLSTNVWAEPNADVATLVRLDGQSVSATIKGIDAKGQISGDGLDAPLNISDLRQLTRNLPKQTGDAPLRIELVGGGVLWCSDLKLGNDQFEITWQQDQTLKLPIEAVLAIRFQPKKVDAGFKAALANRSDENDLIFVVVDDRLAQFKGLMEGIDDKKLAYSWDDKDHSVTREKLYGVVVAAIGREPDLAGHARVDLADGSSLWGDVQSLKEDTLLFKPLAADEIKVPWKSVLGITVRSDRMVFLSDLKPTDVEEETILTKPRSWRKDLNVSGKPLVVASKSYRKGIGVASRSRLVFSPGGKYETFAAVLGIDDETNGRGDCEFVILGDGRELMREHITGSQKPRGKAVQVDVKGVRELTLLVEPGRDLDLADHANWCDARFLRAAKK